MHSIFRMEKCGWLYLSRWGNTYDNNNKNNKCIYFQVLPYKTLNSTLQCYKNKKDISRSSSIYWCSSNKFLSCIKLFSYMIKQINKKLCNNIFCLTREIGNNVKPIITDNNICRNGNLFELYASQDMITITFSKVYTNRFEKSYKYLAFINNSQKFEIIVIIK